MYKRQAYKLLLCCSFIAISIFCCNITHKRSIIVYSISHEPELDTNYTSYVAPFPRYSRRYPKSLNTWLPLSCFLHHSFISSSTDHSNLSHPMPYRTACLPYSHLHPHFIPFLSAVHSPAHLSFRCPLLLAFLFLSGDIELNPGPVSFTLCTLNIRSILHPLHSAALSDLIDAHNLHLFCLTETWIKPTTTSAELLNCTPPKYTLLSVPRKSLRQLRWHRRRVMKHSLLHYLFIFVWYPPIL